MDQERIKGDEVRIHTLESDYNNVKAELKNWKPKDNHSCENTMSYNPIPSGYADCGGSIHDASDCQEYSQEPTKPAEWKRLVDFEKSVLRKGDGAKKAAASYTRIKEAKVRGAGSEG